MPGLINLQTDLKSLRYGSDKPYITKDINNPPSSNQTGMQITKRIDDLSRISQMLIDRPGLKFLGNQALLQQIDIQDKLQKSRDRGKTLGGAILQQALGTVKQTAKILGSTLAQVPVNGTGTHFVYAFRTDTYLQPSGGNIRSGFAQFFGAGGIEGAPLALRGELIEGEVQSNFGTKVSSTEFKLNIDTSLDYETPNQGKVERGAKNLAQSGQPIYSGPIQQANFIFGGQSVPVNIPVGAKETTATSGSLGISNQNITGSVTQLEQPTIKPFREEDQKKKAKDSTERNIGYALTGSAIPLKRERVSDTETTAGIAGSISNQNITAFTNPATDLSLLQPETSTFKSGSTYEQAQKSRKINNTEKNAIKESRINLGDQGAINSDVNYQAARRANNYIVSSSNREEVDKLNALDISTTRPDGIDEARDLAKFFFEVITPEGSTFLNFRAFITSMDDSYNANWETKKYVGRADDFYTYGGFSRDISIGFRIAAATRSEMQPLYKKMIYLASTTAPTYGEYKFMRGTVVRLSLGSYFNEIPGVITSVKYNWNVDYPWEIAMESPEGGETGVQELPMIMDCSISFKPIHDFVPQTGLYHYITSKESGKTFF
jgi:hypothetical protein